MINFITGTHLITVLVAAVLGAWLLATRKGTRWHRWLGIPYMALMMLTATVSLFMPATIGPALFGHFGFIHLFSVLVLYTVPSSFLAIRNGNIAAHRASMRGMYTGAIVVAGSLAFVPGRYLHSVVFGT